MKPTILAIVGVAVFTMASTAIAQDSPEPGRVERIEQYGITWTFASPVRAGRFVTGDWWVIGPVTVTSVTPAPGPARTEAASGIRVDQWGSTSLAEDPRMRNGSMIVLKASQNQAFDSRGAGFEPDLAVRYPLQLAAGQSLVSTISNETASNRNFCHELMWESEKTEQVVLKSAAVLTCLAEVPPADAFRPPYCGTLKPLFRASRIRWDVLPKLPPVEGVPDWEQFERYFQRPWLDHIPSWTQRPLSPSENQPAYGREHARVTSIASLMVLLDVPRQRKEKLVLGLLQRGIDLWGIARAGGHWNHGGGHGNGRKWPILFASILLDDASLRTLPDTATFHEDVQTYYGTGWHGQTALYWMVNHHGPRQRYEHKPPEQWEQWDRSTEGYRVSSTAQGWIGAALAARMMKAIQLWDHDAFFDYCDRWMRPDDPYADRRGGHPRPDQETRTYDPFVDRMWRACRDRAPDQPMAGNPRMLVYDASGRLVWVPNPKPTE
ncbi:MAG: hypothetical protein GX591_07710 [Planctomycetes bacterium]|nr:hypothetical protein [Planctomycetota bacterium]